MGLDEGRGDENRLLFLDRDLHCILHTMSEHVWLGNEGEKDKESIVAR